MLAACACLISSLAVAVRPAEEARLLTTPSQAASAPGLSSLTPEVRAALQAGKVVTLESGIDGPAYTNRVATLVEGDPADLIAAHHGGLLTPRDDPGALADGVAQLAADRPRLAGLMAQAAQDGAPFDDVSVFAHRSSVIRAGLGAVG